MKARFAQLVERASFDLKLARDAGAAAGVEMKLLARIARARREVEETLRELKSAKAEVKIWQR
jgi:GTP1/Obg family GTP-binding protein